MRTGSNNLPVKQAARPPAGERHDILKRRRLGPGATLSAGHFIKARQLVSDAGNGLRTLDALHLAVAVTQSLKMLTADRNLAKIAKKFKTGVILLC